MFYWEGSIITQLVHWKKLNKFKLTNLTLSQKPDSEIRMGNLNKEDIRIKLSPKIILWY